MIEQLIRRIRQVAELTAAAEVALAQSVGRHAHVFGARESLFRPGDVPKTIHLISAGIACRCSLLPGGRRQITGFLLPGDLFAVRAYLNARFDHHIRTVTMLETMPLELPKVTTAGELASELAEPLLRTTAMQSAISREWLINVGQRSAGERIAHLLCELFTRLQVVGLTIGDQCLLPLTQIDLADALALTPVHVNRTLMSMTRSGWLSFRRGVLTIPDLHRLEEIGGFDAGYLQGGPRIKPTAAVEPLPVTTTKRGAASAYRINEAALDRQLLEVRAAHDRISTEVARGPRQRGNAPFSK
jgi:CRP-like cAMP-binding protein